MSAVDSVLNKTLNNIEVWKAQNSFSVVIKNVMSIYGDIMVKQSLCRPGRAHGVPGGCSIQISALSAYEGGKVVIPMHWLPLSPGDTHLC